MSKKTYQPERFQSPEYLAVVSDEPALLSCSLAPEALQNMQNICVAGYPNEVCGLLLGQNDGQLCSVHEVRQVKNINTERASDRFQLDPEGYQTIDREIRKSNLEIVGVFHSHPDCPAKPSPTDLNSAWEGFLYPIISVCDGKVLDIRYWEPNDTSKCFHTVQPVEYKPC